MLEVSGKSFCEGVRDLPRHLEWSRSPRERNVREVKVTFEATFRLETQLASQEKAKSRGKRTQIETDDTNRKEKRK